MQRTKQFINWWNALPEWAKDHTYAYVYREHPVLLIPEGEEEYKYIDKISGNEPLQDEMDMLHKYGCGSYKLIFNEVNQPGKPNRTICTVLIMNVGGGDYKSNPPTDRRISDPVTNLDQNHPSNAAYVAYLKSQGALKKEDEMATATVVDRVLDQNRELTDKVIKSAQQAQQTPSKNDGVSLDQAMRMGMEVVADASKRSNEIMQKTFEQARSIERDKPATTPTAPATDPMEMALKIVALLKDGKGNDDPELIQLREKVEQLRTDQVTMLRDELKSMREQINTRNTGNPFSSIQEGMKAMKDMKTVVDEISGAGDKGVMEEVAGAVGPAWLAKYAPLVQQGFGLVDSFFRYRAAMAGAPMPNVPPQQYPMAPQPGFPQNTQGYPQPQPAPPQAPGLAAPPLPAGFPPELANLLMRISRSLHYHLADINATGTDFASWFMSGEGDETYAEVRGFGVEGIIGALQAFPVTSQILVQFPAERVQMFVTEFVNPNFGPDGDDEDEDGAEGDTNVPSGVSDAVEPPKEPQPA